MTRSATRQRRSGRPCARLDGRSTNDPQLHSTEDTMRRLTLLLAAALLAACTETPTGRDRTILATTTSVVGTSLTIITDAIPNSQQDFAFTTTGGLSPSS